MEPQTDPNAPALTTLSKHNDIVIVADLDHSDGHIRKHLSDQLAGMKTNGVKHLFLEQAADQASLIGMYADQEDARGALIREAQAQGIEVHFVDDRSRQRERAARYPEAAEAEWKAGSYLTETQRKELIANAKDPEKMREYFVEKDANRDSDVNFRNEKMAENIDAEMKKHPGDKAVVLVGANHVNKTHDIDEMLREKGNQVTTAEIQSAYTKGNDLEAPDQPDFVVKAETGQATFYKDPKTQEVKSFAKLMEGVELPWKNTEAVTDMGKEHLGEMGRQNGGVEHTQQEVGIH